MMAVTKSLSSGVHQVTMNDETENIQFVPQIVSTLRLDLVFWPKTETDLISEISKTNKKLRNLQLELELKVQRE